MQTIKTFGFSVILAAMFLSAGAFAGAPHQPASPMRHINVTVINKTSAWPVAGMITTEPCTQVRCVEA